MSTKTLQPAEWARPRGYANGMVARGRFIFVSGQIGWDGNCQFTSDTLHGQVRQTLQNIVRILEEAQALPQHLVRLTWYLRSRADYYREGSQIGAVYREILGRHFPVMSVVEVSALMEELALVEIEATAVVPDETDDEYVAPP